MENEKRVEKIKRIRSLKNKLDAPKFVGDSEDVVPFAWRHALVELPPKTQSKVYRKMREGELSRNLPVHAEPTKRR